MWKNMFRDLWIYFKKNELSKTKKDCCCDECVYSLYLHSWLFKLTRKLQCFNDWK